MLSLIQKYIYVKTQFTHESILTDEPIIVLRGIGFDTFQLKIENIRFSFSDSFEI